jgi:hypothetical protein
MSFGWELRLRWLAAGIIMALLAIATAAGARRQAEDIIGADFGPAFNYENMRGDTWISTWADDGQTYTISDDCDAGPGLTANFAISRLDGPDPMHLVRVVVNPMQDYGKQSQLFGPDQRCWKADSITCVDGVLYLAISRHDYPTTHKPPPADEVQTATDSSIIKSTDYGKTWSGSEEQNRLHPMFPGRRFGAPFFIQYGKNSSVHATESDRYVYAISNDGCWNNGSSLILGRVPRSKIGALKAKDWEFYSGVGRDGRRRSKWTKDIDRATPVLSDPNNVGMSAVAYIPPLKRYILLQWHFPLNSFVTGPTTWIPRQASSPWGPWIPFATTTYQVEQFYNPAVLTKFISDDGLSLYAATAGIGPNWSQYRLHIVPVDLRMGTPEPPHRK